MTKSAKVATYALKKLWLLSAILLVLFAVLLSLLRYALPYVEDNKHLLENYVQEQYGVELTIEKVHAVWQRAGPSIVVSNVNLARNESSPVELSIDEVYIELDFWQSLTQWMISSRQFNLVNLKLAVETQRIESSASGDFPVVDALEDLFLEQLQSFSLTDGVVTLIHESGEQVFDIPSLNWLNQGGRHQGKGTLQVRELASNSASFSIDLRGSRKNLRGLVYAKAEDLDISPWVSERLHTNKPLTESRANFEVWGEIEKGRIAAGFVTLHESKLVWGGENYAALQTGIEGGSIQVLPNPQGKRGDWNIRVDRLIVSSNEHTMVTDLVGQATRAGEITINTVKPVNIGPFFALAPLLTDSIGADDLAELSPQGQLATFQLLWRDKKPSLAAKVLDASWRQSGNIPGLSDLDADIFWYKNQGAVVIGASGSNLTIDNLLPKSQRIKTLKTNGYIYQQGEQKDWIVTIPSFRFVSDALEFDQQIRANLTTGELSTFANIAARPLEDIQSLFPESLMGQGTTSYLNRAFAGPGTIESARILWHGKVSEYPFNNGQGIFQAFVNIKGSEFVFSPDWPSLTKLDLALKFENEGLWMSSPGATLHNVEVTDLHAQIPRLVSDATLSIDTNGAGTGEALTALMKNSGIKDSLGDLLENNVLVAGPLSALLHLDIPLDSDAVVASGTASLSGKNTVNIADLGITLNDVSGDVSFKNDNISASDMEVSWLNQPMRASLAGQQSDEAYQLEVKASGDWDVGKLVAENTSGLEDYIAGMTDWAVNVDVTLAERMTYKAQLAADAARVVSRLPLPFSKPVGEASSLVITAEGDNDNSTISAQLDNDATFDGVLSHESTQFSRAHLALGASDYVALGNGFSISGVLDTVEAESWYNVVSLMMGEKNGNGAPGVFPLPERIFVETKSLTLSGQTLKNATVSARQRNKNWFIDVGAQDAKATINIYDEWLTRGIEVEASLLRLNNLSVGQHDNNDGLDASTLPPLYFHCTECEINGYGLGELTLDVTRADDGMLIRQLRSLTKHGTLNASGKWHVDATRNSSFITGTLESDDVGLLLENYGISSGIKDSEGRMDFTLNWPQSPLDFSVEHVQGDINWSMTDGYLSELSDKGSRIFSLFSLNSLVRKLSLDFRDVFAKGFFYDDMSGSLEVAEGRAVTRDTVIDGAAGEIEIKGYTNLVARELDYQVSFAPNVTGNLPIHFTVME